MKGRLWRFAIGAPCLALMAGSALIATGGSASALTTVSCGAVVTSSITLANDVGPCTHSDGIDITTSGITVNLNGHTITGGSTTNTTTHEYIGVQLLNVNNVTLTGPGTITNFDAGVNVQGGSANVIKRITAHDNIAHVLITGGVPGTNGNPESNPCNFGDGITTDFSSHNVITNNATYHNGPFSGISLVDTSTYNLVQYNVVTNQTVSNIEQTDNTTPGPCGPFGANIVGQGRPHQDVGIRLEGPGAAHNLVTDNTSTDNQLEGIAVFDNICPGALPPPVPPNGTPPNAWNTIQNNKTLRNGAADGTDGIAVLSQGPAGTVCIASHTTIQNNVSNNNARAGIWMGGRGSNSNVIAGNTTDNNGAYGIYLSGPSGGTHPLPGSTNNVIHSNTAVGNPTDDAFDGNPGCDANHWFGDFFTIVNQPCIH